MVPLATVANAEQREPQTNGNTNMATRKTNTTTKKTTARKTNAKKATTAKTPAKKTTAKKTDKKMSADRRGLGGFEKGPQTHVLQRDG